MSGQEGKEIIIESLELESVLNLVRLDEGVDNQADRDGFDLFKQVLEIGEVQLSHCVILRALHQREDKTFKDRRCTRVLLR
jgi:hypothetical protein